MDVSTVSLFGDTRATAAVPRRPKPTRYRRVKLVGALVLTTGIGLGSYAATYKALYLISVPAAASAHAPAAGAVGPVSTHVAVVSQLLPAVSGIR